MIRVLVTGAEGQLGKCLQKIAAHYPQLLVEFATSENLDITDTNKVELTFAKGKYHYCINCAAYTNVEEAEKNPAEAFVINAEGAKNLALACKDNGAILMHISTDYVFDGEKKEAYDTGDTPNPINEYGRSKLKGEFFIQQILKQYYIIRTSWLYSEFGNNFLKTMLRVLNKKKKIDVVSDQIGSPTYAGDLAAFLLQLINKKKHEFGIYHYCNTGITSWYGFAVEIFRHSVQRIKVLPISSEDMDHVAKRPTNSTLKTERTTATFKVRIPGWQESLTKALKSNIIED